MRLGGTRKLGYDIYYSTGLDRLRAQGPDIRIANIDDVLMANKLES
jgi:hypothetical protein